METLLGFVMLAALGYGAYRLVRWGVAALQAQQARSPEEREQRRETRAATRGHRKAVAKAEFEVLRASRALSKAKKSPKLAACPPVKLYEDRIETPGGTHALDASLTASVDTAGQLVTKSRSTLTRMGVGTAIAGPIGLLAGAMVKKNTTKDARELYLSLESGTWAWVGPCPPDRGAQVREFAQRVNLAARGAEAAAEARARRVEQLTRDLETRRAARKALEPAAVESLTLTGSH